MSRAARRLGTLFATWRDRHRERQQLAAMGERELRDIGLAASDIRSEISKPFWRG
ncbi:MAG: DUF1127 domain-containing protein [Acetobacteraceae bacterium]|nr:DUF1127 domain-containing protein [Acetobacteraceae bacterium]